MKILVLGGTGAMGIHLVENLAQQNHDVYVTSRSCSGQQGNITYITGNAKDDTFLTKLLEQHWDSIFDFMVYSTVQFENRYKRILNATAHYIFLSSSRVYADSNTPLTENSPRLLDVSKDKQYLATDEYALTKARQENILFQSEQKNWTIIRPYITYNTERLQLGVLEKEDWLYRAVYGRTIVTAREIQTKQTTLTSGKDVATAMASLVCNPKALGETFHITTDKSLTWAEITNIYQSTLETQGVNVSIIEQDLDSFLNWRQGTYQVIYDRLYNRVFDNSKIKKFLDTSKFIAPQQGLESTLAEFLNRKPMKFKSPNWKEEALKDRLTKQNTRLSQIPGVKQKIKYYLFKTLPKLGRLVIK
ncbi:NAD-dependent epimerase/dehydratase family protein [Bermanella sp. WJH001]|uniref:NAD-dependent epimerase/dehydratase family protein n=1 Tax=Bermanella sp. WJH001 TaxID=3048005 RepID=UPI0024BE20D4|nr:NAD-dependent epimerase/dehydratase family protein [Bermanella sp. WJH001]MDJ1537335.1 NAD-dependent epimerase/dehydratase family protein [Bermanella sp. WJH001]